MPESRPQAYDPSESLLTTLPQRIPLMPVKSTVLFPTGATGLQVGFAPNVEVLSRCRDRNLVVAMVHSLEDEMPIDPRSLEKIGVLARVLNRLNLPGGTVQVTMQGLIRVHLDEVRLEEGYYTSYARLVEEIPAEEAEATRLIERILTTLGGVAAHVERMADVPRILRGNLGDPGRFCDLTATLAQLGERDKDGVLQRLEVRERLEFVLSCLESDWARIQKAQQAGPEAEAGARPERTVAIRKRIASLQAELGELDPAEREALETMRRIERVQLPAPVAAAARREAERLRSVHPTSSEAGEIRNYLDFVLSLPWLLTTEDPEIELEAVRAALDAKHVGLDEVKRRILEFLSVARLVGQVGGPIPCIVGPPDVGKRSLADAIAEGLGRPLVRVQLGGRGETQLVGGRRTRSGARAGKLIEGFREAAVRDPVYLLEEIDLIGLGNVEGDPIQAVQEFLDPESRDEFVDRYVDQPFDASGAILITTANDFFRVPRGLRRLLSEIRIAGYTPEEKVAIAQQQLLPKLVEEHGLASEEIEVDDEILLLLTRGYARDAGLGNLRRVLSAILRYLAHRKATGREIPAQLDQELTEEILGVPRYPTTEAESEPEVGVVTGVAWTASGGELMFIEALKMPGTGRLIITGMLGDVMRESVNAAYSYVRSRAALLGITDEAFPEHDIHIHFPVGATPKDGPSAGAAVTLAVASSLADRPVRHDVAMTGEVTLRGKIIDIGGVKEKVLAAYRAGLRHVILPHGNERDLRDVPDDVREGTTFHFVEQMDEVFEIALLGGRRRSRRPREGAGSGRQRERRRVARPQEGEERNED